MPIRLPTILLILLATAAACGGEVPSEYSDETRAAFMAGCVEDDTNVDLVDVCECTYETAVQEMTFERFRNVEQRLQRGSTDIPGDVSAIILDCIRQVSASRSS